MFQTEGKISDFLNFKFTDTSSLPLLFFKNYRLIRPCKTSTEITIPVTSPPPKVSSYITTAGDQKQEIHGHRTDLTWISLLFGRCSSSYLCMQTNKNVNTRILTSKEFARENTAAVKNRTDFYQPFILTEACSKWLMSRKRTTALVLLAVL